MALALIFGTTANCSDGVCGQVTRTILDPAERSLTHLVIEPIHHDAVGRLVPIGLVESAQGSVELTCTRAQFDDLDPADTVELAEGRNYTDHHNVDAVLEYRDVSPGQRGKQSPLLTTDEVPAGETEEDRHGRVQATDGRIGHLKGFLVDPGSHKVTHVLLREGHLWGRKEVAIPAGAVASMKDGIDLSITRKQVEDLPGLPE